MIHSIRIVPGIYGKRFENLNEADKPDLRRYNVYGTGVYITFSKERRKQIAEAIRNWYKFKHSMEKKERREY